MVDFEIGEDDLLPVIEGTLLQDGDPIPGGLSGATVKFHMVGPLPATTVKVNANATIDDAVACEVSYAWVAGDTDTPGTYQGEWQVTFTGAKPATFPPKKPKISIVVHPQLA